MTNRAEAKIVEFIPRQIFHTQAKLCSRLWRLELVRAAIGEKLWSLQGMQEYLFSSSAALQFSLRIGLT